MIGLSTGRLRMAAWLGWLSGLSVWLFGHPQRRLQTVYSGDRMGCMGNDTTSRYALVDATKLTDLIDLARRAAAQLAMSDPALADALRGSTAEVEISMVQEA